MEMRHRPKLWAGGLAAAASLAVTGVVGYQAAFAGAPSKPTLTLVASAPQSSILVRPCDNCVLDATPPGAHIGGTEIDAGALTNLSGAVVGHYALQSVGVTPFSSSQPGELSQQAVIVVGSDQLVVAGLEEPPGDGGSSAIVGGTGRFAGARGVLEYKDRPDGSTLMQIFVGSK